MSHIDKVQSHFYYPLNVEIKHSPCNMLCILCDYINVYTQKKKPIKPTSDGQS